jgi:hypothetical protein
MSALSPDERLNLQKLVSEMDSVDNTAHIRKVKHSITLRDEIRKLDTFKKKNAGMYDTQPEKFLEMCRDETPFLYNNYMDIFHRFIKDELDLEIMTKLLIVLKLIEDEKVDQNEGSVMVGKVLKELYVDSALKQAEHLDNKSSVTDVPLMPVPVKPLTWKEYKSQKGM